MAEPEAFLAEPGDTREELMGATYRALCAHGYADLTVDRIAAEFSKSKSLIYHHYDGKDDLLLDFLEFSLKHFEAGLPFEEAATDPDDHLRRVLDHVLATSLPEERREFAAAMVELRAQAAHDDRYRDAFATHDRFFRDRFAAIIEAGQADGVYASDVDPEAVATTLVTLVNGSMNRHVTGDGEHAAAVRETIDDYLDDVLVAET
jgi:AcrR family transcriptional regulator